MPDFTLTMATPQAESLVDEEAHLTRAEIRAESVVAGGLLAAILVLFLVDPHAHGADPWLFGLSVALLALSHAARIDLPFAWTAPVQLALVPVLFLLPAWLVPVSMMSAVVIARIPDVVQGRTAPARLLLSPGNAWFTVGAAAVLLAAGSPTPQEAGLPLLALMLCGQVVTDFASSTLFHLFTRRAPLRAQIRESIAIYAIDAALAPVGLLASMAVDESPWYLALMIPMFGVLAVFAGERRTRLRQLTELNGAYRGTAIVLAEVVDADDAYTGMHTRD